MYVCKCEQAESATCYVAVASYIAMGSAELTVHKGELLEMVSNDVTVGDSSCSSIQYALTSLWLLFELAEINSGIWRLCHFILDLHKCWAATPQCTLIVSVICTCYHAVYLGTTLGSIIKCLKWAAGVSTQSPVIYHSNLLWVGLLAGGTLIPSKADTLNIWCRNCSMWQLLRQ